MKKTRSKKSCDTVPLISVLFTQSMQTLPADNIHVLQETSDHIIIFHVTYSTWLSADPPPSPTTGKSMQTTPMGFHETSDHTIIFYIMEAAWLFADHIHALQEITLFFPYYLRNLAVW
jgi:hypothetical protein